MPSQDRRVERVQRAVQAAIDDGLEDGIQVAVEVEGRLCVNIASGFADEERRRKVDEKTLFSVFSVTKGVAATALHLQVARGRLTLDDPVAKHWPEFGRSRKGDITVRDVLFHRSGVPHMPPDTSVADMCDWEHMVNAVAGLTPRWQPGRYMGYHAYTFGWIVGEVVRRTDPAARSFSRFVTEEIAEPLEVEDELWLGVPTSQHWRIADIVEGDGEAPRITKHLGAAIPRTLRPSRTVFGRDDVRRSCHPGAGGIMTARSLARLYGAYGRGAGADDALGLASAAELIAHDTIDRRDVVLGRRVRRGLGFLASARRWPDWSVLMGPSPSAFGHSGAGGSIAWFSPRDQLAAAIVKNRMSPSDMHPKRHLLRIRDAVNSVRPS